MSVAKDYKMPPICACLHLSCINLYISFIYTDILTKLAGNVYGYENMCVQNFALILKKKMATIVDLFENH